MKNFWNKISLTGCNWSSLNAPGSGTPVSHSPLGDSLFPILTYTKVADAGRRERHRDEDSRRGDDEERYRSPMFGDKLWLALHNRSVLTDTVRPVTSSLLSLPSPSPTRSWLYPAFPLSRCAPPPTEMQRNRTIFGQEVRALSTMYCDIAHGSCPYTKENEQKITTHILGV